MKTEKTQKNKINKRIEQSHEISKKKARRSKKIKNALTILDYVPTNSKLLSTDTEMIVDESKQYSAFKLEKSRKTYSGHSPILLKLNLVTAIEKQAKNRITAKYGYKKYRNKLIQTQISGILKKDTTQESYDKWSEEVQNNIKEVEKICRQNPRKDIMQLKRQRKKIESTISKHRKYI